MAQSGAESGAQPMNQQTQELATKQDEPNPQQIGEQPQQPASKPPEADPKPIGHQTQQLTTTQAVDLLSKDKNAAATMPSNPKPGDIYLYKGNKDQGTDRGWTSDGQKWRPDGEWVVSDCPPVKKLVFIFELVNPCGGKLRVDRTYQKHVFLQQKDDRMCSLCALVHYIYTFEDPSDSCCI